MEDKDDLDIVVERGGGSHDISRALISVRSLLGWLMVPEMR